MENTLSLKMVPLLDATRPQINYRNVLRNALKNNNTNDQITALKQELCVYFSEFISSLSARYTLTHWKYNNFLTFGYIASLEKSKIINNLIPHGVIGVILQYFSNEHYEYNRIIDIIKSAQYKINKNYQHDIEVTEAEKIEQIVRIKNELKQYLPAHYYKSFTTEILKKYEINYFRTDIREKKAAIFIKNIVLRVLEQEINDKNKKLEDFRFKLEQYRVMLQDKNDKINRLKHKIQDVTQSKKQLAIDTNYCLDQMRSILFLYNEPGCF